MENEHLLQLSKRIRNYRLELPVKMFLEMHRPLGGLFRESIIVGAPFLTLFFGSDAVRTFQTLCADPSNIDTLLQYLEVE